MHIVPDGGDSLQGGNAGPESVITVSLWMSVCASAVLTVLGVIVAFVEPAVGVTLGVTGVLFAVGTFLALRGRRHSDA
ncbi:hypothetical protein ABT026_21250 [Streptomyces sp. NPDC002734]|uniref:hypothetical protein n=1 Tax=Streptomyces sp. NPDC002734 TaxID=3154426 RepID=UPI00332C88BE